MKKLCALVLACFLAPAAMVADTSTPPDFQMRLVLDAPADNSEPMSYVIRNNNGAYTNVLNIQKAVLLDQSALQSARAETDALGQPVIEISFTDAGGRQFAEVTRQNLHKRLAIIIGGQLWDAPVIQSEILSGKASISGSFMKREAKDLARRITDALAGK